MPVDQATFERVAQQLIASAPPDLTESEFNLLLDTEMAKHERVQPPPAPQPPQSPLKEAGYSEADIMGQGFPTPGMITAVPKMLRGAVSLTQHPVVGSAIGAIEGSRRGGLSGAITGGATGWAGSKALGKLFGGAKVTGPAKSAQPTHDTTSERLLRSLVRTPIKSEAQYAQQDQLRRLVKPRARVVGETYASGGTGRKP